MTAIRATLVLLVTTTCGGKEAEHRPPVARADAATKPAAPTAVRRAPAERITQIRRVKLVRPTRFSQRVDRAESDPRKLAAADTGAIETTDILVVRIESTTDGPLTAGDAPDPVVFFNRVQSRGLYWDFRRTAFAAVPDPGGELASSVFWSWVPDGTVLDAARVQKLLGEIGRGERLPDARLGDGKTPVVPVEAAVAPAQDLDTLAVDIAREERARQKGP